MTEEAPSEISFDLTIAQCPRCGQCYYGGDEPTVRAQYNTHRCMSDRSDEELQVIIDRILKPKRIKTVPVKYNTHRCMSDWSDEELRAFIDRT